MSTFFVLLSSSIVLACLMYLFCRWWICRSDYRAPWSVVRPVPFCATTVSPWSRKELLVVGVLVAVGVLVRIWQFGSVPHGIYQDEAMAALDAYSLATYGTDRLGMSWPVHFQAWGYGQMSTFMSYCMIPFIKVFGFHTWVVRMPTLLWSLAGMMALFGFSKGVFSRRIGILTLAFCAISPWHIMQSRWALDCNLYGSVFLVALWLLSRYLAPGYKRYKTLSFVMSMILFGVTVYCYGMAVYLTPLFLLFVCIWALKNRRVSGGAVVAAIMIFLAVSWPEYLVMAINFFKLQTISIAGITFPYFAESVRGGDLIFLQPLNQVLPSFAENAWEFLLCLIGIQPNQLVDAAPFYGICYFCSVLLLPVGLFALIKGNRSSKWSPCTAFFSLWLIIFTVAGLTVVACVHRLNMGWCIYPILLALAIEWIWERRKKVACVLLSVYVLLFGAFVSEYFTTMSEAQSQTPWFYSDFSDALHSAGAHETYVVTSRLQKYYVTDETGLAGEELSRVLTVYFMEFDPVPFYAGDENASRLKILSTDEFYTEDFGEDTAFVLMKDEAKRCSDSLFSKQEFGDIVVCVPIT